MLNAAQPPLDSLDTLKEQVLEANLELVRQGLVLFTFGNASGIDRDRGLVVIKPSGVDYSAMAPSDMVVTDMDGKVVDGRLRPSSDLATHLLLYKEFPGIGGVVHTHSEYATAWAQAGREIPAYGTTHADYFYGPVPITEELTEDEIGGAYVHNTGLAISRRFRGLDPLATPAVLVAGHAPFCWGKRRTKRPTPQPFWKRSPAWPTTRLPCGRIVPASPRRCWTGTTFENMAPMRLTDRRNDAPGDAPG